MQPTQTVFFLYCLLFAVFCPSVVYVVILTTDAFISREKNRYCCRYVTCSAFLHGRRNCRHVLLLKNEQMSYKALHTLMLAIVVCVLDLHLSWRYCGNVTTDSKHRTPSVLGHCWNEKLRLFFFPPIFIVWHRRSFAFAASQFCVFFFYFYFVSHCGTP